MGQKQRAIVIFPGRGSYAAPELGYLHRHHARRMDMIAAMDDARRGSGAAPVAELDAMERFSPSTHLPGGNASNLIYTCAQADFAAIDRDKYDIVAVCGNSLGWYLALAAAGALTLENGAVLVDTMGHLMERNGVGGQLLCSVADESWRVDETRKAQVLSTVHDTEDAFVSIDLGGTLVLAGSDDAIKSIQNALRSNDGTSPPILPKHAAFHTPLLTHVAQTARETLPQSMFSAPEIPMIDGTGTVWTSRATDTEALYHYTLNHQIVEPYDFAKSVEVAIKEFAPDRIILTGPGSSLGAPIAQCLIAQNWRGMADRAGFSAQQEDDPYLLAMGREEQRERAI